ncbi:hypothetical protein M758_10G160200 [Ceratodon purpureus]|nr:hypothetical protein M758_10G160200 [Ceratodon purpureus]
MFRHQPRLYGMSRSRFSAVHMNQDVWTSIWATLFCQEQFIRIRMFGHQPTRLYGMKLGISSPSC